MKKIIFLVPTLELSGTTNVLYNLLKFIDRTKYNVFIVTISKEPKNSKKDNFTRLNIPILSLDLNRFNSFFFAKKRLFSIINEIKPNIISSSGFRPDYMIHRFLKKTNINKLSHVHANLFHNYIDTYGKIFGNYLAKKQYSFLHSFDCVIFCSNSIKTNISYKYKNSDVIYNGVDTDEFNVVSNTRKFLLRKQLLLPSNKCIYISVGSLTKRKNPILIIKAFLSSKASLNSCLIFLGDGPLLQECKNIASKYDCISFIGKVNNVKEYLQASDFFISASKSEGLPNSVLEAASSGLYCCISDIDQHNEVLNFDKIIGCSFLEGNSQDLSSKLDNFEFNYNFEQFSNKRHNVIEHFLSAKNMTKHFQEKFNQMP